MRFFSLFHTESTFVHGLVNDFWKSFKSFLAPRAVLDEHIDNIRQRLPLNAVLSGGYLLALLYDPQFVPTILDDNNYSTLDIDIITYPPIANMEGVYNDWLTSWIIVLGLLYDIGGGKQVATNDPYFQSYCASINRGELNSDPVVIPHPSICGEFNVLLLENISRYNRFKMVQIT